MALEFGLYCPIPMVSVGSPETAQAVAESAHPLPAGRRDAQYDLALDVLLTADKVGFDLTLFAERHLGHDMHGWVMASAIAARFERMRALVAVHPGLWDPVMIAKMAASLDRIVKGRMAINIVNGWFDEEFEMFGGQVLQGEDRYQRTIEFIDIMRGLWRNESYTHQGKFYKVNNGRLLLKPRTPEGPEIFSVSTSDRGRDFIADHCDWWFVEFPKDAQSPEEILKELEISIADMNKRTARSGRKVRYALNPFVAIGSSTQDAIDSTLQLMFKYDPDQDSRKLERRMIPNTRAGCMGTPEDVRKQIKRFNDLGIEFILMKLLPNAENIRRLGEEIIQPMR
jgi:FMNH2-dependent dimethyl sulfone monooxygenase